MGSLSRCERTGPVDAVLVLLHNSCIDHKELPNKSLFHLALAKALSALYPRLGSGAGNTRVPGFQGDKHGLRVPETLHGVADRQPDCEVAVS